ncbi:MAG: colanic acid biosynthesis glycosyltransferase WcaL, partial [Candidatus Ratteibacteria bacterium]
VVIDGQNGCLVPERDTDALAKKLEFLVLNPNLWQNMGLSGRKHAEKNYDVKKQTRRLEEIYDEI